MRTSMFIPGRGLLYHFDARAKLLLVLLLCVAVFLPLSLTGIWLLVGAVFVIGWHAVGFRQVLGVLKTIVFLLVLMLVFTPLTYRDSEALLRFKGVTLITVDGLWNLALLYGRFIAISYLCTLYVWTTEMAHIQLALQWYGLPFSGALVLTLAFRFIPFIAESFQMIQDAHALRLDEQVEQRHKKRIKDVVPTVTAALVVALKSIPFLAMSLEHRGLGRLEKRSSYRTLVAKGGLFTHLLISITISTVFVFLFYVKA
ncbi:MAG: energy-coupling factor transporter transmembrane component T family protein [Sphaerochaetaceae bacterium]|jgi:energy-coupling factor transport system permease protein